MIEPIAPAPRRSARKKCFLAGVTLLAVLAVGVAVVARDDSGPEPLALVAGSDAGSTALTGAGDALGERSVSPAMAPAADMALYPGYGGIEYRVEGELADLGDEAPAWRINTPALDRTVAARMASALGLSGTLERREEGWVLETAAGNFYAFPAGDGWSASFNRMPPQEAGAGGGISAAAAERAARDLLGRMGVLEGQWGAQTYETEIGVAYACADAVKLAEEMRVQEMEAVAESGGGDTPISSRAVPPIAPDSNCPPPPPPVKGRSVSFFPLLDGVQADWNGWSVTLGPDGTVENLYGTWATFERADDYPLRSVEEALEELRSGGGGGGFRTMIAEDLPAATATGAAEAGADDIAEDIAVDSGPRILGAPEPAIDPAFPCGPEADCEPPKPVVVTINGVEHSLMAAPVVVDGKQRLYLVPAYRFVGAYEDGSDWYTTLIALHPDFIAPPPAVDDLPAIKGAPTPLPNRDDGGSVPGSAGGGQTGVEPSTVVDPEG